MSVLPKFSMNSVLLQPKETEKKKLVLTNKWKHKRKHKKCDFK